MREQRRRRQEAVEDRLEAAVEEEEEEEQMCMRMQLPAHPQAPLSSYVDVSPYPPLPVCE